MQVACMDHMYIFKENEVSIQRDTCMPMFIAALLRIVKIWNQPRHPSTDERIKKTSYIHIMKYFSNFNVQMNQLEISLKMQTMLW
jgi:hypothetical protein